MIGHDSAGTARTSDVVKALSHPIRLRILHELNDGEASPKVLAERLGESLPVVSYHVRILVDLGCAELVRTEPRRGSVEHFYRPLRRAHLSTEEWGQVPRTARESLSGAVVGGVVEEASRALEAGTFDARADRHLSLTELELDEAGWTEVNSALDDILARALALQDRARDGEGPTVRSALALAHFERSPA
jgi:DNA-binding transcriptional ArsR family regulator